MNEQDVQSISDAARALGRKGGLASNPHKEFGSSSKAVQAAETNLEEVAVDGDISDTAVSDVPAEELDAKGRTPYECGLDDYRKDIGGRLMMIRKSQSKSRREVAKAIHVSVPALVSWENGKSEPTASKLYGLCTLLKVSCNYLLGLPSEDEMAEVYFGQAPEPSNPPPVTETAQPSEPLKLSLSEPVEHSLEPEQPTHPMCKDCPLMSTIRSISEVALALSRR